MYAQYGWPSSGRMSLEIQKRKLPYMMQVLRSRFVEFCRQISINFSNPLSSFLLQFTVLLFKFLVVEIKANLKVFCPCPLQLLLAGAVWWKLKGDMSVFPGRHTSSGDESSCCLRFSLPILRSSAG